MKINKLHIKLKILSFKKKTEDIETGPIARVQTMNLKGKLNINKNVHKSSCKRKRGRTIINLLGTCIYSWSADSLAILPWSMNTM
jgi:hypothetical protein